MAERIRISIDLVAAAPQICEEMRTPPQIFESRDRARRTASRSCWP